MDIVTEQGKKPDSADRAFRSPRARLSLFATPVSMYDLPTMEEVNRDLTARLVAESTSVPSVHRSNVGGWHSQNLAGRPESCFRTLLQCIVTRVRETVEDLAKEGGCGCRRCASGCTPGQW